MKSILSVLIAGILLVSCQSNKRVIRESFRKCGPCDVEQSTLVRTTETIDAAFHVLPELKAAATADNKSNLDTWSFNNFRTNLERYLLEEERLKKAYDSCVLSNKKYYKNAPNVRKHKTLLH